MSKSYHKTNNDLKGKTEDEIDDMVGDPDSILSELAKKSIVKKETARQRKLRKQDKEKEL